SIVADLAVSPSGELVFATGSFGTDPNHGFATVAYRTDGGARAWFTEVRTRNFGFPNAIAVGADGRHLFVTGRTDGKLMTVSYRANTGHVRWIRHLKRASEGTDLAIGPDGPPFVTAWRNLGTRP